MNVFSVLFSVSNWVDAACKLLNAPRKSFPAVWMDARSSAISSVLWRGGSRCGMTAGFFGSTFAGLAVPNPHLVSLAEDVDHRHVAALLVPHLDRNVLLPPCSDRFSIFQSIQRDSPSC